MNTTARIDVSRMRQEAISFTEMVIQLSQVPGDKLHETGSSL